MVNYLLAAILLFEIIRLVLYARDSAQVKKNNKRIEAAQIRALEFEKKQSEDWKKIRALEIEELKQLAKESDTMKQIYDEWLEQKEVKS